MTGAGAPIVVVMGVAGAGKTTVGKRLADLLGAPFHEGDQFHPPENVAKMSGGTPLDDADRLPWLRAIAAAIDRARSEGRGMVVACSALKRAYRDILIGPRAEVRLAYLRGTRDLIQARLQARRDHFMPPALLPSQFAALEEPGPAENPIVVDVTAPPDALATEIARRIRHGG
jgi:carbohydrate kinase (thermoresistant glucokinase family)